MFYCEICGSADCCERTDLDGEPILCDDCYCLELFGIDCDECLNGYYEGDKMRCKLEVCIPKYNI